MDGLMLYRMADGGFANAYPATRANSKASEQILYALVAMKRQMDGMRRLYDMRPEQGEALKREISALTADIHAITGTSPEGVLEDLNRRYQAIPVEERMYVANYTRLLDAVSTPASTPSSGSSPMSGLSFPPDPSEASSADGQGSSATPESVSTSDSTGDSTSDASGPAEVSDASSTGQKSSGADSDPDNRVGSGWIFFLIPGIVLLSAVVVYGKMRRKGGVSH
jgi:cobalamin biosynthesis Mg chelatase CobN